MRVPEGGASCLGVGRPDWVLSHSPPPVLGAWARGPVTNPTARAHASWLCALGGGASRAPRGGASCLVVGCPGSGALPRPTAPPWGVRPAPAFHSLGLWCAGLGVLLSVAVVVCCARFPGLRHPEAVAAGNLSLCRGCGRRRASLACLVAPRWCAAPRPVRSLSVLRSALRSPWCLPPARGLSLPTLLGGCAGHVEAGREPGSFCLPMARPEAGALGSLRVVPVRGLAMGLSLGGPSGFGLGLRALR